MPVYVSHPDQRSYGGATGVRFTTMMRNNKGGFMEKIDRKYQISAVSVEHRHSHSEFDSVLFLAKDKALVPTLQFYYGECIRQGADNNQLLGITLLIERVQRWQLENVDKLKVADIDLPAGRSIIEPNRQ